ncbi:MAG: fibrobacter succinogenes major paralogous domain-containing protein [Bacteroidota bacterium]
MMKKAILFLSCFVMIAATFAQQSEILTDSRDGKQYKTVEIGDQVWMAENLNYETTSGSWCLDDKPENCNSFGKLYTYTEAVNACPDGWHLPSDDEFITLEIKLGMSADEAGKTGFRGMNVGTGLKSDSGWLNDGNGNNSSGFNALPACYRSPEGVTDKTGIYAYFWTSTKKEEVKAYVRNLYYGGYSGSKVYRQVYDINYAFSVRCLKD